MIICFPHRPGSGGPGSFQILFEKYLTANGCKIEYRDNISTPDLIFIVGGTIQIFWLLKMKLKKIPILYRLDGLSWLHKKKSDINLKTFLLTEIRNFSSKIIHAYIADYVIYQSLFVQEWWNQKGFRYRKENKIIYNGSSFSPNPNSIDEAKICLTIIEGNIDYSPYAIRIINHLADSLKNVMTVKVYGGFENYDNKFKFSNTVIYEGYLQREKIESILYNSIYFSLDINPACPNTVIEALNCGIPVVAFDTGALKEIVSMDSGILVPYGSNPWKLEYPDVETLVNAILIIRDNYFFYSKNAITNAKKDFTIEIMGRKYLEIFREVLSNER